MTQGLASRAKQRHNKLYRESAQGYTDDRHGHDQHTGSQRKDIPSSVPGTVDDILDDRLSVDQTIRPKYGDQHIDHQQDTDDLDH